MRTHLPKDFYPIPEAAECVFEGVIYDIYQWQQILFDGSQTTFEMLKRPDSVQVIAVVDGKVVVLDEQQPPNRKFNSLPGGRHDKPDEDELVAAQRETLEETGMTFGSWTLLEALQPHVSMDYIQYFFLATDLQSVENPLLEPGEKIAVEYWALEQAQQTTFRIDYINELLQDKRVIEAVEGSND